MMRRSQTLYRVTWRRNDGPPKSKLFRQRRQALRQIAKLQTPYTITEARVKKYPKLKLQAGTVPAAKPIFIDVGTVTWDSRQDATEPIEYRRPTRNRAADLLDDAPKRRSSSNRARLERLCRRWFEDEDNSDDDYVPRVSKLGVPVDPFLALMYGADVARGIDPMSPDSWLFRESFSEWCAENRCEKRLYEMDEWEQLLRDEYAAFRAAFDPWLAETDV